uniref:hypothetical protein n=1 Tax=Rosenbergiella australiborealis TaxID=1544696 RepID=UPI001F4DC153
TQANLKKRLIVNELTYRHLRLLLLLTYPLPRSTFPYHHHLNHKGIDTEKAFKRGFADIFPKYKERE